MLASLITLCLGEMKFNVFGCYGNHTSVYVCVEKVVQELKERRYVFDVGIQERMMTSIYASLALSEERKVMPTTTESWLSPHYLPFRPDLSRPAVSDD